MERNNIKQSSIKFVSGLCFILFGIVSLINVGYISQTIVIMFTFVFGVVAYWLFFPLSILIGIYLIATHKKQFKFKTLYIIFISLLIFAILIISTIFVYFPNTSTDLRVTNFNQLFYSSWLNSCPVNPINNYMKVSPFALSLGGGWFGYLFASLLNSAITPIGGIISMIFIMVIALIILLFTPVKKLIIHIKEKRKTKVEEEKVQLENLKLLDEQENEPLYQFEDNSENIQPEVDDFVGTSIKKADLFGSDAAPEINETIEAEPEDDTIHVAQLDEQKEEYEQEKSYDVNDVIEEKIKEHKPIKPYVFPSYDLLTTYKDDGALEENEKHCKESEDKINEIFTNFRLGAHVVGHTIGPRVTRYDIQMDATCSVQSINKYMQDIKSRLGGVQARFESVVIGKTTSGLEVPNIAYSTIGFKEMIESFPNDEKSNLMIPFGKNISGEIKFANLAAFPHLLVAGSTGSGKSVFVHSVIMSLIMRNSPEQLRLLLVDPKRVEFTKYKNLPHLLCPTVTEPDKAQKVLKKLTEEMNHRYTLFENTITSKITEYNKLMKEKNQAIMPYIVVVVDEFADLMQQNKKIDQDIAAIAAKARAAGIHLIIATQRPSVDVITGTIKNNLPVRVALSVPDQESSKTIIGGQGAESLLGNGDMLVSCPQIQSNGTARVQGCYVSNDEIISVVKFINEQREPSYDVRFLELDDYDEKNVEGSEPSSMSIEEARAQNDEELFYLVKEDAYKRQYISMSLITRDYNVGINRAGRVLKRLQKENLVGLEIEGGKGYRVLKENFGIKEKEENLGSSELLSKKPF